ncbi:DUF2309 domain-containing protein [Niallia sp. Krafla_26]|uniref:DUF2309 domain-containing protein n=1 Tax=Niallia sp. Krafla_26 TaxID=3064703 RepID=UPI003D162DEB
MNSVLSPTQPFQQEKQEKHLDFHVKKMVGTASRVIVPLGPITAFAARHPWVHMEHQSFEKVARFFKTMGDVDLLPNESMIKKAVDCHEINMEFLEIELQHWLEEQNLPLPKDVAGQYCMAALQVDEPSQDWSSKPEWIHLKKKLTRYTPKMTEKAVVRTYSQLLENEGKTKSATVLNSQMIKWCKLYLDQSQAVWSMPKRKGGFYQSWKNLVQHDPALKPAIRKRLKDMPDEAEQALKEGLLSLEMPYTNMIQYLESHLLALPGWAGMMLWRSQNFSEDKNLLTDYLAVRLSLEWALVQPYLPVTQPKAENKHTLDQLVTNWFHWGNMTFDTWFELSSIEIEARLILSFRFDEIVRQRLWLEAWEKTYEDHLKKMITAHFHHEEKRQMEDSVPNAQFVFCIDVRSEPFRRKLEDSGPFETFGTAGFFGLPIETCKLGSEHRHPSLPVMFQPQIAIKEMTRDSESVSFQQRKGALSATSKTFKGMKHHALASLMLPEVSGPLLALQTLARSFVPRKTGSLIRKARENWLDKPSTELTLSSTGHDDTELPLGFSDQEKVSYVSQALRMMGLTERFSPLVVICGHGSHSTNNPYSSSLDCGACGGASSEFNARVLASLCNLQEVRQALKLEGIHIPEDTIFVAAEHITSTDELRPIYVPELSVKAKKAYNQVRNILPKVREEVSTERIEQLPTIGYNGQHATKETVRFSEDWSEIRPEWGLARNASFIIGKRELTKSCHLEGRAFLHNYDWEKDEGGRILADIIKGPATVTQWINLQYYASTVAPHYYGSGNKTTQTVTSGVGVMQGNSSDLLSGLPWQSVMSSDHDFYHRPLRLLVVIQAPKRFIEKLLKQDPAFQQKVRNGWIRLSSIDEWGNWVHWS